MPAKNTNKTVLNAKLALKNCAIQLKDLRPYITAHDRRKAMAEYDVSYGTVGRYLTGKAPNLTLGTDLLNFFVQQLKKREEIIKGSGTEIKPLLKKLK